MKLRRIISWLLTICMIASMVVFANAAGTNKLVAKLSDVSTVKKGEEFTVDVVIDNNPGILGVNLSVVFDKAVFTPVSYESKFSELTALTNLTATGVNLEDLDTVILPYESVSMSNVVTEGSVVLGTLKFKALADSSVDSANLDLVITDDDPDNVFNEEGNVDYEVKGTTVTFESTAVSTTTTTTTTETTTQTTTATDTTTQTTTATDTTTQTTTATDTTTQTTTATETTTQATTQAAGNVIFDASKLSGVNEADFAIFPLVKPEGSLTLKNGSSVELAKKDGGKLIVTIDSPCTLVIAALSTSSSNESVIALYDSTNKELLNKTVTGSTATDVTYEITKAGVYTISNPGTQRGTRINTITVTASAGTETTTVDTTTETTTKSDTTTETTTKSGTTTETTTKSDTTTETTTKSDTTTETTTKSDTTTETTTKSDTTTETTTQATTETLGAVKAELVGTNAINFVASINSLDYKEVGFIFSANDNEVKKPANTVYTSIADSTITPDKTYVYAFTVTDIPDINTDIKVSHYTIDFNGNVNSSEISTFSVTALKGTELESADDEILSNGKVVEVIAGSGIAADVDDETKAVESDDTEAVEAVESDNTEAVEEEVEAEEVESNADEVSSDDNASEDVDTTADDAE